MSLTEEQREIRDLIPTFRGTDRGARGRDRQERRVRGRRRALREHEFRPDVREGTAAPGER